jgi:hypothetical protein
MDLRIFNYLQLIYIMEELFSGRFTHNERTHFPDTKSNRVSRVWTILPEIVRSVIATISM